MAQPPAVHSSLARAVESFAAVLQEQPDSKLDRDCMIATLEVRWFFKGAVPADVLSWLYGSGGEPAEPLPRVDHYLRISEGDSLGIKLREGRIEVKQRQRQLGAVRLQERVIGMVEHWRKWSFALASEASDLAGMTVPASGWVGVRKERQLSRYRITADRKLIAMPALEYPDQGCDLELTSIRVSGSEWWTLGFEAFGGEANLQGHLSLAAEQLLGATGPPPLPFQDSYGYPKWLQILAQREEA